MDDIRYSALSVDVEDGVNIAMRDMFNINIPPTERVIKNINNILSLFNENGTKGTFFVLGEIADTFPDLIKSISSEGHEIGVHGYYHDLFYKIKPQKAREDLYRAKSLLEEIIGNPVYGFRAPAFSITHDTAWALNIIAELGFRYDSSIMPVKVNRYGWAGFNKKIHRLLLPGGDSLIEVPLSAIKILGKGMPACGGGYLRHFPLSFTKMVFKTVQKQQPVIVYLHPYEIDKERYPDYFYKAKSSVNLKKRLALSIYRINKGTVVKKLRSLINEFQFKPINEIINILEKRGEILSKPLSLNNN
jgi:polysaccharide deacetylase family protein (PEP-CTERM system associated)